METEWIVSTREPLLSEQHLRGLIRDAHGRFAPDIVGRALRHPEPMVVEDQAEAVVELLTALIDTARERLCSAGIEPQPEGTGAGQKLSKREREYVSNIAVLLVYLCAALTATGRFDQALEVGLEGLGWARAADDHWQQSVIWRMIYEVYVNIGAFDRELEATARAIETARASGDPAQVIAALTCRAMQLVGNWRPQEAEALIDEAFALMDQLPDGGELCPHRGSLLNSRARIPLQQGRYAEGIRILHEALHWAELDLYPVTRAVLLTQLGAVYLRLAHYQHAIECQHEVLKIADMLGLNSSRGWGGVRLGAAYLALKEYSATRETLDRAEEAASKGSLVLRLTVAAEQTRLLVATEQFDRAMERCRAMLEMIGEEPIPDQTMFAYMTMGDIELRSGRYEAAERHYRLAHTVSDAAFPKRSPDVKLSLAQALSHLERDDEVAALLDEIAVWPGLSPLGEIRMTRLRAELAERRGDLRAVVDYEREAFELERALLQRQSEQSLLNARIIAETDLLEREADLERERRRRIQHELADVVVQLRERERLVEDVRQRLRSVLTTAGSDAEKSAVRALREVLTIVQGNIRAQKSPLPHLSRIDEEFYARLRKQYNDLTPKQERLCGLIRARLSSKEIEVLLGLTPEGLKAQRKRLRKRLGLEQEISLEKVLAEI